MKTTTMMIALLLCMAAVGQTNYTIDNRNIDFRGKNFFRQPITVGDTGTVPSAIADFKSTSKGVLVPRMTSSQMAAISSPATGLLIYNTSVGKFHWYNGSAWVMIGADLTGTATQIPYFNNTGTLTGSSQFTRTDTTTTIAHSRSGWTYSNEVGSGRWLTNNYNIGFDGGSWWGAQRDSVYSGIGIANIGQYADEPAQILGLYNGYRVGGLDSGYDVGASFRLLNGSVVLDNTTPSGVKSSVAIETDIIYLGMFQAMPDGGDSILYSFALDANLGHIEVGKDNGKMYSLPFTAPAQGEVLVANGGDFETDSLSYNFIKDRLLGETTPTTDGGYVQTTKYGAGVTNVYAGNNTFIGAEVAKDLMTTEVWVNNTGNTVIGAAAANAVDSMTGSIIIGYQSGNGLGAASYLSNNIIIGRDALTQKTNTVVVGNYGQAQNANSIALGNYAQTSRANQLAIHESIDSLYIAGVEYSLPHDIGTMNAVLTDTSGNGTLAWTAPGLVAQDSAAIYATTPASFAWRYCTDCSGNGITGRVVAYVGSAWRRMMFE